MTAVGFREATEPRPPGKGGRQPGSIVPLNADTATPRGKPAVELSRNIPYSNPQITV